MREFAVEVSLPDTPMHMPASDFVQLNLYGPRLKVHRLSRPPISQATCNNSQRKTTYVIREGTLHCPLPFKQAIEGRSRLP